MTASSHTADIQLFVARDPLLLLERAAEAFLRPLSGTRENPFPSPPYLLALRQGGLRDDLMALAAERGVPGWFDPPLCVFRELPDWLGATKRKPLDDFERAVLLAALIRATPGDVFGRVRRADAFVDAVDRLFGELIGEGVTADAFQNALEQRADRDEFDRRRDRELADLYRRYVATLEREERRDGRDTWLDCAAALHADPAALAQRLGGRREIRLLGLQDLRAGWRGLMRELGRSPALDRVAIYTADAAVLDALPGATLVRLDERETIATRLFTDAPPGADLVQVIQAPDTEREIEEVARRVRELVEGGVPPDRIAVAARQARPCVDLALSALDRFGVPAFARRRVALGEVAVVRALRALFVAAGDKWSRSTLVELAEQPYFATRLDPRILNLVGYRQRLRGLAEWRLALGELLDEAVAEEQRNDDEKEQDEHRRPPPPADWVRRALEGFERFADRASALERPRTLLEWVRWLEHFLSDDQWRLSERIYSLPPGDYEVGRLDLLAWREVGAVVKRWREALERWGEEAAGDDDDQLPVDDFAARLDSLLEGDVAVWAGNRRGVPVLEGLAAEYRSFEHLFLVGLEAGSFPRRAPVSPIFDERDRQALAAAGLPLELRETWDARERELFRTLSAGARSRLTVSFAKLDPAGRDVVRSAFVDALGDVATLAGAGENDEIPASRVIVPGGRITAGPAAREQALHAARIEWERASGRPSVYSGQITDPEALAYLAEEVGDGRRWSPSQLESYAKCPWAWFSGRLLHLELQEDPDEEMDPATRGAILHDALRRFFEHARQEAGHPVFLRAGDSARAERELMQALDEALSEASAAQWVGHPALLPAKKAELQRILRGFLEWEIEQHEKMIEGKREPGKMIRTGADAHEEKIDDVVLERDGIRIRFRGSIDRVEVGVDERFSGSDRFVAAVDYKTSAGSAPGGGKSAAWDDGVVLQVPLYAYALTRQRSGKVVARVEYRALRQRKSLHVLQPYTYDRNSGGPVEDEKEVAQMERALDDAVRHVKAMRAGEFPVEPAESCGCPFFCHALDICRIPGGPKVGYFP